MRTKDLWIVLGALFLAMLLGGRRMFSGKFWTFARTSHLAKMKLPMDAWK
jgi:hypothetical protein